MALFLAYCTPLYIDKHAHGCYALMYAGAAVSCRSMSHKSVMLSTAAAEYHEASEAFREIAFIRRILADICQPDRSELIEL